MARRGGFAAGLPRPGTRGAMAGLADRAATGRPAPGDARPDRTGADRPRAAPGPLAVISPRTRPPPWSRSATDRSADGRRRCKGASPAAPAAHGSTRPYVARPSRRARSGRAAAPVSAAAPGLPVLRDRRRHAPGTGACRPTATMAMPGGLGANPAGGPAQAPRGGARTVAPESRRTRSEPARRRPGHRPFRPAAGAPSAHRGGARPCDERQARGNAPGGASAHRGESGRSRAIGASVRATGALVLPAADRRASHRPARPARTMRPGASRLGAPGPPRPRPFGAGNRRSPDAAASGLRADRSG